MFCCIDSAMENGKKSVYKKSDRKNFIVIFHNTVILRLIREATKWMENCEYEAVEKHKNGRKQKYSKGNTNDVIIK